MRISSCKARASQKHAEYTIKLYGNIIYVTGSGVVTESILRQYHHDVKKITQHLSGEPWGFLGWAGGVGIMTPEAEQFLVQSIRFRQSLGMCACALITEQAAVPSLVSSQFKRVYEQTGIAYLFCKSEEEAISWLATQGCHLTE